MIDERSEFGYLTDEEKEYLEEQREAVREVIARRQREDEAQRQYTENLKARWQ